MQIRQGGTPKSGYWQKEKRGGKTRRTTSGTIFLAKRNAAVNGKNRQIQQTIYSQKREGGKKGEGEFVNLRGQGKKRKRSKRGSDMHSWG